MTPSNSADASFYPGGNLPDEGLPLSADREMGWHYESTVAKIEEITARIETGELELAEVFNEFATAVEYLHQCEAFLTQRQQQLELLIETLDDEPEF